MKNTNLNTSIYDTMIRMFFLILIVAWCLLIMKPFAHIMLWGIIIGISFAPLHNSLTKRIGGRSKLASAIIVIACLAIIIVPSLLFLDSLIHGVKELKASYQAGTLTIPTPSEKVKSWPIIGEKIHAIWSSGSFDIENYIVKYKDQLKEVGSTLANGVLGATSGIVQLIVAIFIAGVLLVVSGTGEATRRFFKKVAGKRGDEFTEVIKMTIGSVVKGVLGVAIIQASLTGIGFLFAGIPLAGLWTLLVLILAILQITPSIVVLPIVIYMFSEMEMTPAVLWTIYLLLAGLSDNVLKPILLSKGAPVPMMVIFIGVIGGFIFSGFAGLFTGAIVLSIGYKLFIAWLNSADEDGAEIST